MCVQVRLVEAGVLFHLLWRARLEPVVEIDGETVARRNPDRWRYEIAVLCTASAERTQLDAIFGPSPRVIQRALSSGDLELVGLIACRTSSRRSSHQHKQRHS
jgi:hypothetical protein